MNNQGTWIFCGACDMDKVFVDAGVNCRAHEKLDRARQGNRHVFDYNIYYLNLTLECGYDL